MKRMTTIVLVPMLAAGVVASAAAVAECRDDAPSADAIRVTAPSSRQQASAVGGGSRAVAAVAAAPASDWAKIVDGALTYKQTGKGDRIMDFSTAGFGGGGVALPTGIPVRVTLSPSGGDDSDAIQQAIDTVSARDRGSDRYRGAVKLNAGTFRVSRSIDVNATGVVVIGSGSGNGGTVVELTGTTGFTGFRFGVSQTPVLSNTVDLTSSYIKSGSNAVLVGDTSGFAVGQRVQLSRKVTSEWVRFMGMDTLVRDGQPQTWLAPGTIIATPRAITAVDPSTKKITFDGPITDSFDSTYLGSPVGTLSRADYPGRISWVGMEHLVVKAPAGTTIFPAVEFRNTINGYLSDVIGQETQNAFKVERDAQSITFDRVVNAVTVAQTNGAPAGDFSINGGQVLLNKCESRTDGTWALVTGATGTGPLVLLNFKSSKSVGIGPHQRWYTGVLVDTAALPNATSARPGVAYTNRGNLGSGHGWTTGWSVAWNVTTAFFKVQSAPGTTNWCIGCAGSNASPSPVGTFDSPGAKVGPASLYLQQLYERKGISALNAIGYLYFDTR